MQSERMTRIYTELSQLFAQQRQSLLTAAGRGFRLEGEKKYERRHARIVELYEKLARLEPSTYWPLEPRKSSAKDGRTQGAASGR